MELMKQRQQLETRLEELELLSVSQGEIKQIANDAMEFITSLEHILRHGLPQEKLAALRRCVKRILVNKPEGKMAMQILLIPAANLCSFEEIDYCLLSSGKIHSKIEQE